MSVTPLEQSSSWYEVLDFTSAYREVLDKKIELLALAILTSTCTFFLPVCSPIFSVCILGVGFIPSLFFLLEQAAFPEYLPSTLASLARERHLESLRQTLSFEIEHEELTEQIVESKMHFWWQIPGGRDVMTQSSLHLLSNEEKVEKFHDFLQNNCRLNEIDRLEIELRQELTLPKEIGYFSSLKYLSMRGCSEAFPEQFTLLQELETLHFEDAFASNFPSPISYLTELRRLTLCCPRFLQFPGEITRLPHLQRLRITDASFNEIPSALSTLCELEVLDLQGNRIQTLPQSCPFPPSIQEVNLASNHLQTLPVWTGANLEHLRNIRLESNVFFHLPENNPLPDTIATPEYVISERHRLYNSTDQSVPSWIPRSQITIARNYR